MPSITFHKVAALPTTLEPGALYFVQNGAFAEAYLSTLTGEPRAIGNSAMVNALIVEALSSLPSGGAPILFVADIAARNALVPSLTQAALVRVQDASADVGINAGGALYAWNPAGMTWIKLAEDESMDLGSMANQDANNVAIGGGVINNTVMDGGFF